MDMWQYNKDYWMATLILTTHMVNRAILYKCTFFLSNFIVKPV